MTLEALLVLLREMILNDRSDRVAGSSDYLWTDETLVIYMNEAQRRFARKGLVLRDGRTPEVTQVTLVAGQSQYALHPSVLGVISARMSTRQVDLVRTGHATLGEYRAPSESWIDPAGYTTLPPGQTLAYSTDEDVNADSGGAFSQITLRVHPVPSAVQDGETVQLRVVRKPIEDLSLAALTASPEIPEDHHIEMLDWAAYLALRIVDDDAGAARDADKFRASFEEHVREARNMVMRKLFTPMGWGFGRGGFSWSS